MGQLSFGAGRASQCARLGNASGKIGIRNVGKNESAREGIPLGAILR
tara:strand:+ start:220 stop:360 length:141 start_codon:yes stop_codon:yes gene_type:complete